MRILRITTIFIVLSLLATGCIKIKIGTPDGGVFKSVDGAGAWSQKAALLAVNGQNKILTTANVTALVFDPEDSGTLYLGTKEDGLFVSFDAAESWQKILRLPEGKVNSIAVHPKAKHTVYAAIGNRIFKSLDCCRTWENVYLEAAPSVEITTLAIDPASGNRIYAGLSDGRIIMSQDNGLSWLTAANFGAKIRQILVNPNNPQIIYAASEKGIFRSASRGAEWNSLNDSLKEFAGGERAVKLVFNPNLADGLISASEAGLLRSDDGGTNWIDYKLLAGRGQVKIYSLAVNPGNPNVLYYVAAGTLYKSEDGGATWKTRSLPTKQKPTELLIDFANPNILYLGVEKLEQ